MADVPLTVTQGSRSGAALAAEVPGHATDWYTAENTDGKVGILVRNADAAPQNVIFETGATVDGQTVTDRTETVANGTTELFSDFPVGQYGNPLRIRVVNTNCHVRAIKL